MNVADQHQSIPISSIVEPWILLRPVRKDQVEYLELRDSVGVNGLLNSICVRPSPRWPGKFEIIDGNYRYHCARDCGHKTLPCIIKYGVSDDDVLALQIQANGLRPETTKVEYSRQLKRIFESRPGMTFSELARLVHKSIAWVKNRLGLLKLSDNIQLMVDRGEIPVGSAYMLSKIPHQIRADYLDPARTLQVQEFNPLASKVIKQFREGVHQSRMDERYKPKSPQPHLRSLSAILGELNSLSVGPLFTVGEGCRTPIDGWVLALKWVLHTDCLSIEKQERVTLSQERRRKIKQPEAEE